MGDCAGSLTVRYGWVQSFYWMGFAALMGFASLFLLDAGFRNTEIGLIIALSGGISALLQPAAASLAEGPGRVGLKNFRRISEPKPPDPPDSSKITNKIVKVSTNFSASGRLQA